MQQYMNLIKKCITEGNIRTDRTNTGTISIFGPQMEFDLSKGFPLDTSRQIFLRGIFEENFWMLRGSTDNNELVERNVYIWDEWALRQEDLEFTQAERLDIFKNMLIREAGDENAGHLIYLARMDGVIDIDAMLELAQVPKLRPNPEYREVGQLGPVYGEQWRFWPDPKNDKVHTLSIEERIKIAEDMLAAGVANKFTEAGLRDLKKDYAEAVSTGQLGSPNTYIVTTQHIHARLNRFGVAEVVSKKATIDQITKLIDDLKKRPNSRRHVVSAWNVTDLPDESLSPHQNVMVGKMALAPCHALFQFYVEDRSVQDMIPELPEEVQRDFKWFKKEHHLHHLGQSIPNIEIPIGPAYWNAMFNFEDRAKMMGYFEKHGVKTKKLSCKLYQRSADGVLGTPFNIAAYSAMTMMIAQCVDMAPGMFIHTFGDFHIYKNHLLPNAQGESVFTQLAREERPLPKLWINPEIKNIFDFKYEDFRLEGYDPHPRISYPVAV